MIARGLHENPELHLKYVHQSALPFSHNSFDAIIVCAVFTCITSHEVRLETINELYRILKSGGIFHMVEFCSEPSKRFTSSMGVPMLYSSPKELHKLISKMIIVSEEIANTNTISGNKENTYSLFARKSLNQ